MVEPLDGLGVHLGYPLHVPLPGRDVLVGGGVGLGDELLEGEQRGVAVGLGEVGERVALGHGRAVADLGEDDAVGDGAEAVVGQALHRVADVHDELGGRAGLDAVERAQVLLVLGLEPAGRVLEQQRDGAEVGVLGDARRVAVGQDLPRQLRVVQQPELVVGLVVQRPQVRLVDVQRHGQRRQQPVLGLEALLVEVLHLGPEARERRLVGPPVGLERVAGSTHVKALLRLGVSYQTTIA